MGRFFKKTFENQRECNNSRLKVFFSGYLCRQLFKTHKNYCGQGVEVEIDECLLVRRKYNKGRVVNEQCVFGGREVDSYRCIVVAVPNGTKETLVNAIIAYIKQGSVITSDCWPAYGDLKEYGYTHLKVNHSESFVDPLTGATTNHVKNMWQKLKPPHKVRYGTHRSTLNSHLIEFMWRVEFKTSLFSFIQHIKDFFEN
jgi:hypothetical protein